ncbi:hypothetical protein AQ616_18725 [Oceanobacillus sp. E9]|uniref:DUF4190 domain-containing protein n=1 Tax=Oceanobacillus sp. E9 TaxID=1742575 RepID=UPI00084E9DAD|nr:DUF4190 domain-containing protein [Oceanobacillus sp. E9]OEH53072.1 hypothetical protein AQ616_18725 [Oceanobacillus sp. E9]
MSGFLGAIGIVGILSGLVLFVLGFIKKKKYRGGWIALASLVLTIIAVATTPEASSEEPNELTAEEKIIEKLGEKTNQDQERLISYSNEDGVIEVVLAGDQSLDDEGTLKLMLYNAQDVFPILFEEEQTKEASINIQQTFVDKYGKESEQDALQIMISQETNDKITWENFNIDNFSEVADDYYVHPGIE